MSIKTFDQYFTFVKDDPNKSLLLSLIKNHLFKSSGFKAEVQNYFDQTNNNKNLFDYVKKLAWGELFKQNLTQNRSNMPISLFWDEEDFKNELDTSIHQFIEAEIDTKDYLNYEYSNEYFDDEYVEAVTREATSNEPENFDHYETQYFEQYQRKI